MADVARNVTKNEVCFGLVNEISLLAATVSNICVVISEKNQLGGGTIYGH